jgi:hypothetical protein
MPDNGRNFTTAVHEAAARTEDETFHYTLDGKPLTVYLPTTAQLTMLLAATVDADEDEADPQSVATVIQAFMGMLDAKSQRLVRRRLLDVDDSFDLSTIVEIIKGLAEDVVARPTRSPSDFLPSRQATGTSSTASSRPKGSTRSRSVRAVSST